MWKLNVFRYFPEIYNASGWRESKEKFGDWFSYERSPRARIFRRDHAKVTDITSMTRLMRYTFCSTTPLCVDGRCSLADASRLLLGSPHSDTCGNDTMLQAT